MDFSLDETQEVMRNAVRDFAASEIAPAAQKHDHEKVFPEELLKKMGPMNLLGLLLPAEVGGAGVDTITFALILEELGWACASTAVTVNAHNALCTLPILKFGTDGQKSAYLPGLASGERLGGFAFLDGKKPVAAVMAGGGYMLSGEKEFVLSGGRADTLLVTAALDGKQTAFILGKGAAGVVPGEREETLGLKGADIRTLKFEECAVDAGQRLGGEGDGGAVLEAATEAFLLGTAAVSVGIARAALESASSYANTRVQFGQTISRFEAIQMMVAEMSVGCDAARLLTLKAAHARDKGEGFRTAVAAARSFAADVAIRAGNRAVQVHGGVGYTKEYPVERFYRDSVAVDVLAGSADAERLAVARAVLGL